MFNDSTYPIHELAAAQLMKQWPMFMNGMDRIIGFWPSGHQNSYQGIEWKRPNEEYILEMNEDIHQHLKTVNGNTTNFKWLRADKLPFITNEGPVIGQLDLFSESNILVLLIKQKIGENGTHALYYLFFRDDKSNFGLTGNKEAYSTSEKAIIGRLAYRFADNFISQYLTQIKESLQFKATTGKLLKQREEAILRNEKALSEWKNLWLDRFLNELSQRNGFNYVINENVRTQLFNACSSLAQIEESVVNSFVYICNLQYSTPGDTVELEAAYVQIADALIEHAPDISITPNRHNKTIEFLDKLEKSAQKVVDNGYKLTSAEVGKHMDKAITAPAISDALKKNSKRILLILNEHPHLWPLIRKQFKPIINLKDKYNSSVRFSS